MTKAEKEEIAVLVAQELMSRIETRERVIELRDRAIARLKKHPYDVGDKDTLRAVYGSFGNDGRGSSRCAGSEGCDAASPASQDLVDLIAQAVADKMSEEGPVELLLGQVVERVRAWGRLREQKDAAEKGER